ncbi:hypothetical protein YB2330_005995 [Saitoella coloradoensis]
MKLFNIFAVALASTAMLTETLALPHNEYPAHPSPAPKAPMKHENKGGKHGYDDKHENQGGKHGNQGGKHGYDDKHWKRDAEAEPKALNKRGGFTFRGRSL